MIKIECFSAVDTAVVLTAGIAASFGVMAAVTVTVDAIWLF